MTVHDMPGTTIHDTTAMIGQNAGPAVLVVNGVSRRGVTPAYAGLQAMHTAPAAPIEAVLPA